MVRLADPGLLLLGLLFLPALLPWARPHLGYSSLAVFGALPRAPVWARLPGWAMGLGICLLLLGFARPQAGHIVEQTRLRARDIILAIDLSGSMQRGLPPEGERKIDLAKEATLRFVDRRRGDRIGLLVFGDETYGSWPLSSDLRVIRQQVRGLRADLGGTDLVKPVQGALAHFREAGQSRARALVLVTDGEAPISETLRRELRARLRAMGVRVYLLGIGLNESADIFALVNQGGGRVWNASEAEAMRRAFEEIDRLEPSEVVVEKGIVQRELHPAFTLGGLTLLGLAVIGTALAPRIP